MKLKWFFHENSDFFFPAEENTDFGFEVEFVHEIGDYKDGTEKELRTLL